MREDQRKLLALMNAKAQEKSLRVAALERFADSCQAEALAAIADNDKSMKMIEIQQVAIGFLLTACAISITISATVISNG